jgi:hypothetical protein
MPERVTGWATDDARRGVHSGMIGGPTSSLAGALGDDRTRSGMNSFVRLGSSMNEA